MYAAYMAAQPATRRFPFGFARFEVLSGFANAIFLVFVGLSIVLESVERMYAPPTLARVRVETPLVVVAHRHSLQSDAAFCAQPSAAALP
jgi:Co/Zn/Cd efflux system component